MNCLSTTLRAAAFAQLSLSQISPIKHLLYAITACLVCLPAFGAYTGAGANASRVSEMLSTNWLAEVRSALPSERFGPESTFQQITNLLCARSRSGNVSAQGLWGWVVLIHGHSAESVQTGLELVRNSGSNGYVPAMLNLGFLLEGGVYVPQDYKEALYWFSEAAARTNSDGLLQVGGCYHYGLGATQNLALAADYYRRASDLTNYIAMKSLGYLYMNGLGVRKDPETAKLWLLRAAIEGKNPRAMLNLGALSSGSNNQNTNQLAEAFGWWKRSADLGDPLASLQVARLYYWGLGVVETNIDEYRFWRLRAATLGATEAQYLMGAAFRDGDGVEKNTDSSLLWLRKAAAKNHPSALYDLALYYLRSKTNGLDRLQSATYMMQAAKGGHRDAQYWYAMSLLRGETGAQDCETGKQWLEKAAENNVPHAEFAMYHSCYVGAPLAPGCAALQKDIPQALDWLRRASSHGDPQAQATMAVMMIRGTEMAQNKYEAERLLRSAAKRGFPNAQNDLGYAILDGDTQSRDLVEAGMWCTLAKQSATDTNVVIRAEVNVANICSKLSNEQFLQMQQRVRSFHPAPPAPVDPLEKNWEKNPAYQQEDGLFGH
jgi:hypothetical protein